MHKRKNASTSDIQPLLLTVPQVATLLGIGKSKVYVLIKTKGLPCVRVGDVIRVPRAKLQQWIEQQAQTA